MQMEEINKFISDNNMEFEDAYDDSKIIDVKNNPEVRILNEEEHKVNPELYMKPDHEQLEPEFESSNQVEFASVQVS
jgi:hypothetical protein